MTLDIVGMGEPLIELNQTRGSDGYRPGVGGDTSNAIVAAARCGARTGYFTALGDDVFGRSILEMWRGEGVDVSQVRIDAGAATGIYFVTHGPQGHEFSYMRAGSAASRVAPTDVPQAYVASARALHVSAISQAISASAADAVFAAIDAARGAGRIVCYDTNLRLKLWPLRRARAIIHEAIRSADIARPGLDDAQKLTGLDDPDAIADFYLSLGAKIVALTLGADGSLVATPDRRERIASVRVEAVDATGAGDAYDGAFLAEYLRTNDPFRAARFANAAAALSTQGYGAVAPLPTRAAVLAALGEA
ncbi:MAG: sugar kinase [Rhizobiales bacterium]|nr:sugar kinase [Hyphomicrobiales bacterium]